MFLYINQKKERCIFAGSLLNYCDGQQASDETAACLVKGYAESFAHAQFAWLL